MTFILLRACVLVQRKRCLQEFVSFGRSVTCFTRNSSNIKKFIPALQTKHFSTEKDEEPERILVHKGLLGTQLRNLKAFSLLTSLAAFVCQPILYMKASENDNIVAIALAFATVSFFAVGTPLLLHLMVKRYVTHLYYYPKENKYLGETYTFFLRKKKIQFTVNDVYVPDVPGMFTSCIIKGAPIFLHEKDFTDVQHYFHIMGHYKPVDFKLSNVEEATSIKENSEQLEISSKR